MKLFGLEFLEESRGQTYMNPSTWAHAPTKPELFSDSEKWLPKKPIVINSYKNKSPEILILAGESISAGYLSYQLKKLGQSHILVNLDEFIFSGAVSYSQKSGVRLKLKNHTVEFKKIKKIFYLPPQFLMGLSAHPEVLNVEEKLLLSRWRAFLHDLKALAPHLKWIPGDVSELYESSQNKLSDLVLAEKLGIKTPETILTMEPKEAKAFLKRHKERVIFREFSSRRLHRKNKILTFRVDFVKSKQLAAVTTSPIVLQEYIEKKFEYRVVVVGKKAFACQINSQAGSAKAKKDWRHYEFEKVSFTKANLPSNIIQKLLAIAEARGLKVSSFDLIQSPKGDFYFLEMNRPGAWLFVEALTGHEITRSIAQLLT